MNVPEVQRSLRQLRLDGMAAVLETRLRQAQAEPMAPIDLVSCLVSDELERRAERLLERRRKQAGFRDVNKTLDNFDFTFNPKMNRRVIFDLAACGFIARREDALLSVPAERVKSYRAGDRTRRHRAGLPRPLSRNPCAAGRACRSGGGRDAQATHGPAGNGAAAHQRRLRHAQTADDRGGRFTRNHHASL